MVSRPRSILALDLGATAGFCWIIGGRVVKSGSTAFEGARPERERALMRWLQRSFDWLSIDAVVYERPFCRGLAATRSLWGMAGVAEAVACGSAAVLDVNIQTIKKWAGAGGDMGKSVTLRKAEELLGYPPEDDNHADAVCLAFYAAETMEIED